MAHHHHAEEHHPRVFEGRLTRQGEIVLKRPWQRAVFLAGFVGIAIVALIAAGLFLR